MKKFLSLIALTLILTMALTGVLSACNKEPEQNPEEKAHAESFVSIDINPSIELVLDQNQTVMSVNAANSDAQVMLYGENGIVGATLDVAVGKIANLAVECEYVTEENSAVSVTITSDAGTATETDIYNHVSAKLTTIFSEANITASVDKAVDLVLSKELARVKAANAGKAGYDDSLTVAKFRAVKAAMRCDRKLTMDVAVTMSVEALAQKVTDAQANWEQKLGDTYALAVSEAQFNYTTAKEAYIDSLYAGVFTARPFSVGNTLLIANSAAYTGLKAAHRTISHYAELWAQLIENPIFTDEDVLALGNALGIGNGAAYDAFKADLQDENGEITKESVEAYVNMQYRNLPEADRAALESAYADVQTIISGLQLSASASFEDQGNGLANAVASISVLGIGLSVNITTYASLEDALAAMQTKITSLKADLDAEMTEDEKADLATAQANATAKIAEYETEFNNAVAKAKTDAEAKLAAAKAAKKA